MNKKKLLSILLACGSIFWLIPSGIFNDADKRIVFFFYGFHMIMAILYSVYLVKFIKDEISTKFEWILIYLSVIGIIIINAITYALLLILGSESSFKLIPWVLVLRGIVVLVIIIYRYSCYEVSDFDVKLKQQKEEEKRKLKEKENEIIDKQRKKKNNKWLYKIIFKDFKANFKNYIVFVISAVLTFTYVYGFLGNLIIIHNIKQTDVIDMWSGITLVVANALLIITIVTIIIQFYALKNYIQNRMYDLKTLLLLGMKKKEIFRCMAILLTVTLIVSYLIGITLGNVMIYSFRKVYSLYLQNIVIPNQNIILVTLLSFILCLVIIGIILAVVNDMVVETRMLEISNLDLEEKGIKPRKIILILPVILLILFKFYSDPHWAESFYIIYPFIIIFVIFTYYSSGYIFTKIKSKNKFSINNILTLNLMYYKSRSYMKNMLTLFVLLFVMFFSYVFKISTLYPLNSSELYPYDYVCLGYEKDKQEFENIKEKFDIESEIYPVVRVTVPGGEDGGYGDLYKSMPIGHHLGISESTYTDLTGKVLDLNKDEVSIIYQEDKSNKAHPLDFYADRTKPLMRIGQAQPYDIRGRRNFFNLDYKLKEEKREIVFGRLSDAMYENLVVFSDGYFNSQYNNSNGIRYIMTINSNKKNDIKLENYLNKYLNTHNEESKFDGNVQSVYKSKDLNKAFQGDKIFEIIINISIVITFAIASIIIVLVNVFGNIPYYKKRYEILSYLGEKNKNSNSIIKKEVWIFAMVPFVLALLISQVFILITVKMRGFSSLELLISAKVYISIILMFLFIYGMSTFITSHFLIKRIGGK